MGLLIEKLKPDVICSNYVLYTTVLYCIADFICLLPLPLLVSGKGYMLQIARSHYLLFGLMLCCFESCL